MSFKILISKKVRKFISSRTPKEKSSIKSKISLLAENPYDHPLLDVKPLKHELKLYRLRINKYRFIYEVKDEKMIVIIFTAGSRGNIYKKL